MLIICFANAICLLFMVEKSSIIVIICSFVYFCSMKNFGHFSQFFLPSPIFSTLFQAIKTTRITGSLFFGYKPHVPLGAEAPSRKNYQPHYISQQPLLRGCYFLLGSPVNGSTSSFKTICSSTTSSCNCSRIYFFIASLFLPTVST